MHIEIRHPDWNSPLDRSTVLDLLDAYANDLMGGGHPLSDHVRSNLCKELAQRPSIVVLLAFQDSEPAGLCIANEGFSTFACKPLLNIHDLVVTTRFRGRGIARALMEQAHAIALRRDCCKLTLEVLENNAIARSFYNAIGFSSYELDPAAGKALFLEKKIA